MDALEVKKAEKAILQYEDEHNFKSKSNEPYVEWTALGFVIHKLDKKTPILFDRIRFVDLVIKNKFDVKKTISSLLEERLIDLEKGKISRRIEKRKIREKAEKNLFGSVKSKRIPLSDEERDSIFDKFNSECVICGSKEGLHIHHKDKNPSNNQISNLLVLCGVCHKKIHMKVR